MNFYVRYEYKTCLYILKNDQFSYFVVYLSTSSISIICVNCSKTHMFEQNFKENYYFIEE